MHQVTLVGFAFLIPLVACNRSTPQPAGVEPVDPTPEHRLVLPPGPNFSRDGWAIGTYLHYDGVPARGVFGHHPCTTKISAYEIDGTTPVQLGRLQSRRMPGSGGRCVFRAVTPDRDVVIRFSNGLECRVFGSRTWEVALPPGRRPFEKPLVERCAQTLVAAGRGAAAVPFAQMDLADGECDRGEYDLALLNGCAALVGASLMNLDATIGLAVQREVVVRDALWEIHYHVGEAFSATDTAIGLMYFEEALQLVDIAAHTNTSPERVKREIRNRIARIRRK